MPEAAPPVVGPARTERGVMTAVTLAACLAPLNSTMLIVALPHIVDDYDTSFSAAGWLVTGYLIAVAALQTPAGKLGDRVGHRRLFLGGLVAFLVVSVAAAAAPTVGVLIVFRVGQGVAGAVVFPNGWALLRAVVPAGRRAQQFGMVGSLIALAAATGPPLGDAAVALAGWRFTFLVNVFMVVPAFFIGRHFLPAEAPTTPPSERKAFDVVGVFAWLALLLGAATVLNLSVRYGKPMVGVFGAPAVVLFGVWFVRHELAHPDPVLQPRFFAHPAFAAVNVANALSNLAMYVTLLAVPIMLARREGGPGPGLVLSVLTVLTVLTAPRGGRLADRIGRRTPAILGLSLSAVAFSLPLLAGPEIPLGLLVLALALAGIGLGLSSPSMQTLSLESVPAEESGVASGVYSTSRYLGSIVGSSVLAAAGDPAGRPVFTMVVVAAVLAALAVTRVPRAQRVATARNSGESTVGVFRA